MQHTAAVGGAILLALRSRCVTSQDATARPRRYVDGHPIVCGRGSIPVRAYAPPIVTMRGRSFVAVDQ
jgi:hypothetical protein